MIVDRNVTSTYSSVDECADAVFKLARIHLDGMGITDIDNLECLGPVTHVYLHNNAITALENIDCLTHVRFLSVAGNRISALPV